MLSFFNTKRSIDLETLYNLCCPNGCGLISDLTGKVKAGNTADKRQKVHSVEWFERGPYN